MSDEGPEVDEFVCVRNAHFGGQVLNDRQTHSVVVEGMRVKNMITKFQPDFENRQVRGLTEATLSRYVDGLKSAVLYRIEVGCARSLRQPVAANENFDSMLYECCVFQSPRATLDEVGSLRRA